MGLEFCKIYFKTGGRGKPELTNVGANKKTRPILHGIRLKKILEDSRFFSLCVFLPPLTTQKPH